MNVTASQISAACAEPDAWLVPLNAAMPQFEINTPQRVAAFLAQCAHESIRFTVLEENLNYSADAILRTWPTRFRSRPHAAQYARDPAKLASFVYANRNGNGDEASGDGWTYRGRGPIQNTGRGNYRACAADTGSPFELEPDRMALPFGGALAAAWFFWQSGCNEVADEGDIAGVSGIVNRGSRHKLALHNDERRQWYEKLLPVMLWA